ncbi:ABC transporter substrate-binding protein [Pseudomonas benzenivorans]|uniref:ABC transporter substrate-binding protein n=1 Tax=Pseudomonas benzenivorans TaxID=556533 RepID=A0ABZ0Q0A1_9PSED|nr:ABC transporter substrate-binding protein [Pseudomonas benzenivorans]WPC06841.1 ABC transporter substrate-binding protein [Pseudomonas benzenivorans]
MKPFSSLLPAAVLAVAAGLPALAAAEKLTISCGAVGAELQLCREGVEAWSKQTGHSVEVVSTPNSATERLSFYQQILSAQSSDIDIIQIDVVWPGMLANHLLDLNEVLPTASTQGYFQAQLDNATVAGRLVTLPWFTDSGLLYYRKDLLEQYGKPVPQTWDELTATAKAIQQAERDAGNANMWGYVFQGRAYEGLTCNALEWIGSHPGGALIDPQGQIAVDSPATRQALSLAKSWVGDISPRGVLNYTEEEGRGVFQSGNAVFMRNWPYVWALAQSADSAVKDKVAIAPLPKGGPDGKHASTLGGWGLSISRYSAQPKLAGELVAYLTSAREQKHRALVSAYNPVIESLYQDPELLAAMPYYSDLHAILSDGVMRPASITGDRYPRVSNALFDRVHGVLAGETPVDQAVSELHGELKRIKRRSW